jgi:hypothetical protein
VQRCASQAREYFIKEYEAKYDYLLLGDKFVSEHPSHSMVSNNARDSNHPRHAPQNMCSSIYICIHFFYFCNILVYVFCLDSKQAQ